MASGIAHLSKMVGGVMLIIGTSIGAGMLAMPIATASGGFISTTCLLIAAWIIMTFGALYLLEVNLWFPEHANLVSMASGTLGRLGEIITWLTYLFLLYALLSAYVSGGGDVVAHFLRAIHINTQYGVSLGIFLVIFGVVLIGGVHSVDWVNRLIMTTKLVAYFLMIILIVPHIKAGALVSGHPKALLSAVTIVITSYGYAIIVPTLRTFFKSDVTSLRRVILIGSTIPLIFYILWELVIFGAMPFAGPYSLLNLAKAGHTADKLLETLSHGMQSSSVIFSANLFTSLCVFTSFLGVSLALSDFLSDGLRTEKKGWGNVLIYSLTLLPPLLLALFFPKLFIWALSFAGIMVIVLLILLPAAMVWWGRYVKQLKGPYEVWGGKPAVILVALIAFILLWIGINY